MTCYKMTFLIEKKLKQSKQSKQSKQPKKRDQNIQKAAGQELNLNSRSIPSKKNYKRKEKHKGRSMKKVYEVDDFISSDVQSKLALLARVSEDSYEITERGIRFTFENSLQSNQCQIINYHDKFIVEFRKKTDNMLEGKMNQLVFEDVIRPSDFQTVFESVTGIYLSYLGV